jgi:AcrR family transcriptional regulator
VVASVLSTEQRIYRAALRLLEKKGPEAVTMRRIARAVRVTPMAIYHHFATREDLLKAVVDREFGDFLDLIGQLPAFASPEQQFVHIIDGYLEYAFRRPQIFDYVFSKSREDARRFPDDFRARRSPSLNPLADTVTNWMKTGRIKRDDVWEVTLQLWAHAHGYIALFRAGRFNLSQREFKALVHRSMRRLLYGLEA